MLIKRIIAYSKTRLEKETTSDIRYTMLASDPATYCMRLQ